VTPALGAGLGTVGATPTVMRNLFLASALTAAIGTAAPSLAYADSAAATDEQVEVLDLSDEERYAAAEQANPDAEEFRGGATVVFIGSTAAFVLGIILLLLIL
jgi:hypothetical protein